MPFENNLLTSTDPRPPRVEMTSIHKVEGEERQRVAAFMAAQFKQHFNATLKDDTEEVYAIYGDDGGIDVAFGLNRETGRFFARHYVADVEEHVRSLYGLEPVRHRLVEFAHLCVRNPRVLCRLVPLLARFLAHRADYLICTATRELGRYFVRKGLAPDLLAAASIAALPPSMRTGWGTYYMHEPVVLTGSLKLACTRLNVAAVPNVSIGREVQHVA